MSDCAPNLTALIGEQVGARLISHAGSLTNLAKYPASTVQILGAEKALFRALKTRGKTPKYGLIFHSTFIGRAQLKNKGRISRYLANKCSLASRIDSFNESNTQVFGDNFRQQVEERLEFYKSGKKPRKNIDVIQEAVKQAESAPPTSTPTTSESKQYSAVPPPTTETKSEEKVKKEKKKKKRKAAEEASAPVAPPAAAVDGEKKKKKKKKQKTAEAPAAPSTETALVATTKEKKKKKKKEKEKKEK